MFSSNFWKSTKQVCYHGEEKQKLWQWKVPEPTKKRAVASALFRAEQREGGNREGALFRGDQTNFETNQTIESNSCSGAEKREERSS